MNIIMIGQIAGACVAIGTALALGVKWLVLAPIKLYIDSATYPLSPDANGGMALPDAIRAINDVKQLLNDHIDRHDTPQNTHN
jgi:hypothetical protein